MIFLKANNFFQSTIQIIINLFFRLMISINKKISINYKNNIFLTGDFFWSLSRFKRKKNSSKIIFSTIKDFPKKKDYQIYKNKIWIFHNSDEVFDVKQKKKLDFFSPKKCFSQNLIIKKKNYHFLPIGLENNKFHNHGNINDFLRLRKIQTNKTPRILYGFKITNPKRIKVRKYLRNLNFCDETKGWNSYIYRRILMRYMFIICPEGNGIDTHRFWEALYLKTIPIIKKNRISSFLQKLNLPIIILDNWSDISNFNEIKLKRFYQSKKKFFNNRFLFQKYWKNIINRQSN